MNPAAPLIAFEHVTICHGLRPALEDVSFSIAAGEHVAILGPNGSGKSTLIAAITRDLYPRVSTPPGRVRLWGEEVWDLFDLRARLGVVTNQLVEQCARPFSALETALSGFFGSIGVWPYHPVTPEMERRARAALDFFEISHLAERPLSEMSSGEVRRAVFARALVHDPQAMVLDEPANSLDVRAQREVRAAVEKLAAAGVSIILVTHHLPDIIPAMERIITLKRGRVFGDGPKRELLTAAHLSALFEAEVQVAATGPYYHLL
jgi:iron complex transport system ATP-binding protein